MMKKILFFLAASIIALSCSNNSDIKGNDKMNNAQIKNPYYSRIDTTILKVPDSEWKKVLSEDVYNVARNKSTERAYTGKYWDQTGRGTYYCAACGNKLFRSDAWFASGCGWPSFFEPSRKNAVAYEEDTTFSMQRIEVLCGRCGAHLGHVFDDGPAPTYKRFCMNSIVLDFEPDGK
jgi:peptide-methionine (R)-S-oxide reductase